MYYSLKNSIDRKVVGTIPQSNKVTEKITGGLSIKIREELSQLLERDDFPEHIPILNEVLLDSAAKVTDMIDTTYLSYDSGIIASVRMRMALSEMKFDNYKCFDALVTHNKREYPYSFFLLKDNRNSIDFTRSEFVVKDSLGGETIESKQFDSYSDYDQYRLKAAMKLHVVYPLKIVMLQELDIIRIPGEPLIFVSEKFKQIIDENKFTGMNIQHSGVEFVFDLSQRTI
ncbi:MAG: hypothetical protein MUF42_10025 [Cytophagaceae bacterium]|jgi:hypothetical protein|nr:hypothetical protein [Cytophagaceae bacterium]